MLAKMFSGEMRPGEKDADGAYLIDRSPDYFKPILNYFRTGEVIIDPVLNLDGVLAEAKYYGIERLILMLQDLKERNNQPKVDDVEFDNLRKSIDLLNMYKKFGDEWKTNGPNYFRHR